MQEPKRIGFAVLAHPIVAFGLVLWLLNDHVWKAQHHSWWTGKLSDVVGLFVFPLLVATAIERAVKRPMPVAVAFTAIFFSAINVWAPADAATEWILSQAVGSQLTMDPTDLITLPALAGAVWLWRRVELRELSLRRSWGGFMFGIGIATTLATTPAYSTDNVTGTIVLTAEEPVVVVIFGHDGVDDEPQVTWGHTTFADLSLPDGAASPVASEVDIGRSDGEITFTLTDVSAAPVEVHWSANARNEIGMLGGSTPELTAETPSRQLHAPLATLVETPDDSRDPWEWPVTVPADAEVQLGVSSEATTEAVAVVVGDRELELRTGVLNEVPKPQECDEVAVCTFSIWLSITDPLRESDPEGFLSGGVGGAVQLYGDEGVAINDPGQRALMATTRTFETDEFVGTVNESTAFRGSLTLPELTSLDQSTALVSTTVAVAGPSRSFQQGVPSVYARGGLQGQIPVAECCKSFAVSVGVNGLPIVRDENDQIVEQPEPEPQSVAARIEVTIWSLEPIDPNDIELTFTKNE